MKKVRMTAIISGLIFIFLLSSYHPSAGGEMQDLTGKIIIAGDDFFEWFPVGDYNSIENEFAVFYRISGFLDPDQVGVWMSGLNGRRVLYTGDVSNPIADITLPGPGLQAWAKPAYNSFRNEYMVSFVQTHETTGWDVCARILDAQGNNLSEILVVSAIPAQAQHPCIVFNPVRRVYFITWDDNRNGHNNIFGIMLNEDGSVATDEFVICDAPGDHIFTDMAVNNQDGSCLISWEDFRHTGSWISKGDIYGALVSSTGEVLKKDIPICDDYGKENEGDQREQHQTYNSMANNFFVVWFDSRPTNQAGGINARIISATGEPVGDDFSLVDAANPQIFCSVRYHEKTDRIFAVWDDSRNNVSGNGKQNNQKDIYARWFRPTGAPDGPEIPINTEVGDKGDPKLIYNPLMDSFLIAWRNYSVEEKGGSGAPIGGGHITESPGNIEGMIFGTPWFMVGRVIDKNTGAPLKDATTAIMNIGSKVSLSSNQGGWFTIAEDSQKQGWYLLITRAQGYHTSFKMVKYEGSPIVTKIELSK